MDEDPDDLAAAFFAAQAAKEAQKTKLPTEDWVAAISSIKKFASNGISSSDEGDVTTAVNEWLVTTIPSVSQSQDGEIALNAHDCSCNLIHREENDGQCESISARNEEVDAIRDRLKQALVKKLLEELNEKK